MSISGIHNYAFGLLIYVFVTVVLKLILCLLHKILYVLFLKIV